MPDLVDLFNAALVHLGLDPVDDPDGSASVPTLLRARWPMTRDYVLRDHPWNCAEAIVTLEAAAAPPPGGSGFTSAFKLPADPHCLRVIELLDYRGAWKVLRGRALWADAPAPLAARLTVRIEPEDMDAMLAEGVALRLAYNCATKLSNRAGRRKELLEAYAVFLNDAKSVDGQEGSPPEEAESDFLSARR